MCGAAVSLFRFLMAAYVEPGRKTSVVLASPVLDSLSYLVMSSKGRESPLCARVSCCFHILGWRGRYLAYARVPLSV
jgi:hypothetical protein